MPERSGGAHAADINPNADIGAMDRPGKPARVSSTTSTYVWRIAHSTMGRQQCAAPIESRSRDLRRPAAMDYQAILHKIQHDITPWLGKGRVADYIPELAKVDPLHFGMAIVTLRDEVFCVGDAWVPFSIQSISKLFACTLAFQLQGDALWQRVGREPSGNAFNSLVQLEHENGVPRNPFINAGALVVTDVLCRRFVQAETALVQFMRRLAGRSDIDYSANVAESELAHSDRNRAMAHFMKSFGNLQMSVDTVIDAYCRQCAIEMNCVDLARAVLFLANGGVVPHSGERVLGASPAKRLSALMLTCGTYDAAGDFVYHVGLPAKSGVGGGIVAVLPGELGICVWSPALDANGNSLAGMQALEWLTTLSGRSIF
ncbi:Glutaminase (EC 3.5.1.2) [Mycetohabitans rhizoxinica HKI 454]|uniref:Glutaminase n=2 Tax=Mycetohabitans rhizoxinica TaxID=412963 RepID=E5AKT9_MYCRK|nr:Glutaminase (EC 3.5.1.2) [Mycetohabitans rhizoxinica HKI 454]